MVISTFSEEDVVRRCRLGDEKAFRSLIEHFETILFGTALLIAHDRQIAEEAVQEATVKIWHNIGSLRNDASVKAWLMKIVVNEVKNQFRHKKIVTVSLEQAPETNGDCDIDEILMRNESHNLLSRALSMLPPNQKEVLTLRYFAELTVSEIAAVTSTRQGTVKSRISRGLNRMNQIMQGEHFGGRRNQHV